MEVIKNGFENKRLGIKLDVYVIDGKEWFKAQDVSNHLDYIQASDMLRNIDFIDDNTTKRNMLSDKGNYTDTRFINEIALYECVLKIRDSKTDLVKHNRYIKAREFQRWVFEEVLPSLRKNNFYIDKDNITQDQIKYLKSFLFDFCSYGKMPLGSASKLIFGEEKELKIRLINLGYLDYEKCKVRQIKTKGSNDIEYDVFCYNVSGTYVNGVTKEQLQVSLTNAGFAYFKHLFVNNKDLGDK